MRPTRPLTALATAAALLLGPAAAASAPLASTGYVEGGTPPRVVARDAHALTTLGVDGVTVTGDGGSVTTLDPGLTRLLAAAHRHGLRAELLVSNYSSRLDDFDPRAGARLLRDPSRREAVAARLAGLVAQQGWDGVQVDLESLTAADAAGLTAFVQALRVALPAGASVSVAVMASTSAAAYADAGYQLAGLGQAVDTLTLMTYDQHGPGWSGPGPIGALGWQRRSLAPVLAAVPASKVDLGVAGYGYTWPAAAGGHPGRTLTDAEARRLVRDAGVRAVWHDVVGEWSARLPDGTVVWWSDHRSYRLRAALARSTGLHGLSVWRLGSMDPLPGRTGPDRELRRSGQRRCSRRPNPLTAYRIPRGTGTRSTACLRT